MKIDLTEDEARRIFISLSHFISCEKDHPKEYIDVFKKMRDHYDTYFDPINIMKGIK